MSKIVAQVVEGIVEVKSADGDVRILQQGDMLMPGDTLITAENGSVVLAYLNETVVIAEDQTVVISDSWLQTDITAEDSVVDINTAEGILAVLDEEGDLLEQLEATAAGGAGSAENNGNSFVRLTRIVESNDPTLLTPGTFTAVDPVVDTPIAAAVVPADDAPALQPAVIQIDNITADDIINAAETAATITISGSATGGDIAPGDVVTMVINGTTYTTTVQADGTWSVDVVGSDLAADTEFDVVVTSSDAAGNTVESSATSSHTVDLTADAGTVTVNNITADDVVNAAEAAGTIAVTGSATGGDIAPGDVVTMVINGTTYTSTV
ncbi:retention module-containing protein, partial [Arsukibacterium sp.]|uniref:retention module-containing protein n=1 Tax=Arsukibacterium sp. TaxID=1977258 RepID=UPI00299EA3C5